MIPTVIYTVIDSPLGPIRATGDGTALTSLSTPGHLHDAQPGWIRADDAFALVRRQLTEYFAGQRQQFDLPLAASGTAFQRAVWTALTAIPYGRTVSYSAIAADIGAPTAVRAVGAANGRNPISIIVPCHRVIGADGSLTGYAGGLETKRWLLAHERAHTALDERALDEPVLF